MSIYLLILLKPKIILLESTYLVLASSFHPNHVSKHSILAGLIAVKLVILSLENIRLRLTLVGSSYLLVLQVYAGLDSYGLTAAFNDLFHNCLGFKFLPGLRVVKGFLSCVHSFCLFDWYMCQFRGV